MAQNEEIDEFDEYGFRKERWDLYKPKKYYIHPENEYALKKHLQSIEDKLKEYKHHEDIPRLLYRRIEESRGRELYEEGIYFWTLHAYFIGKAFVRVIYGYWLPKSRENRIILKFILATNALSDLAFRTWLLPQNQPQNMGIYEQLPHETKLRNLFDYKFDLYRNINKIKYTDPYINRKEVIAAHNERKQRIKEIQRDLYKKYGYAVD